MTTSGNTTSKINCIIIDDEPLARAGLREYIQDIDFLFLQEEFDHPLAATSLLGNGNTDLLFLDIQMPKITGIDFVKTLKNAPAVIFTTAYPQYALDGFDVNALDYLVKPISFERFFKAALKAKEWHTLKNDLRNQPSLPEAVVKNAGYFFIKSDNVLVKILLDDVLFVEGMQNYVTIYTATKKYVSYLTIKSVEDYLPADRFIKVHKSFIIAANRIDSIDGNEIRIGERRIPLSRSLKEEVTQRLLKGKFLKR